MKFNVDMAAREARRLPPRQREALRLLAGGRYRKEIAIEMGVAYGTGLRHVEDVFKRLGVHNKAEATRAALAARIV